MTPRKKILDKIKKCMALSKSCEQHEAAAALRQAQKLMEAHGVSDVEMLAAGVSECAAAAGVSITPSMWEKNIAGLVGKAFACATLFRAHWRRKGSWVFVGGGAAPEVAKYTFEVLFRQARKARTEFLHTSCRRIKKPATKTRRADLFCEGWVGGVAEKVTAFAATEEQKTAIAAYLEATRPSGTKKLDARDRNAGKALSHADLSAVVAGGIAAQNVTLNRGVGGQAAPLALERGAA